MSAKFVSQFGQVAAIGRPVRAVMRRPGNPESSPPTRSGHAPVLSVGRKVFVNARDGVVLTDEAGRSVSLRLADGVEVEIVAWRPRGRGGTRYRIHSTSGDADGWVSADELRAAHQPVEIASREPPDPAPSAASRPRSERADESGRKFGQRR